MVYMQLRHLQQVPRCDIYIYIYIAQWLSYANVEILHLSDAFAWRQKLLES